MRTARCALTLVLLLAAGVTAAAQPLPRSNAEAVGMSTSRLARIDTVMQKLTDSSRAAGISVLVIRDGHIVKSGTYGWADREARAPMARNSLFRIASQTKAITSVAAMMLVEEGRLRLNDPVHRWIPGIARATVTAPDAPVAARRAITIRDLLTHTAGISYGVEPAARDSYRAAGLGPAAGAGWYFSDKDEPICTTMDRLSSLPFATQPGERFVYGYSTDMLGCIIERVSGMTLDEFFRTRIFAPLRMTESWFFVPAAHRSRLAAVYAATDRGLERAPEGALGQGAYVDGPRMSYSGGAGLVSTIDDYARFLQMLLNEGELDGVRLLAPHTVRLMAETHVDAGYAPAGLSFGLGFEIVVEPGLAGRYGSRGSYGWGGAYATSYWVDPAERLVLLIMTQTRPAGELDAADRFRAMVYSAIIDAAPVGGRR